MRYAFLSVLTLSAATFVAANAGATDLLSQDEVSHTVTITTKDGQKVVEIAPKGDLRNLCEGCNIALEDGQSVEAGNGDIVSIVDGRLAVEE